MTALLLVSAVCVDCRDMGADGGTDCETGLTSGQDCGAQQCEMCGVLGCETVKVSDCDCAPADLVVCGPCKPRCYCPDPDERDR